MKIKMLRLAAGPRGVWRAGQVAEVETPFAKQLIDGRYAEAFDKPLERGGQALQRAPAPSKAERFKDED